MVVHKLWCASKCGPPESRMHCTRSEVWVGLTCKTQAHTGTGMVTGLASKVASGPEKSEVTLPKEATMRMGQIVLCKKAGLPNANLNAQPCSTRRFKQQRFIGHCLRTAQSPPTGAPRACIRKPQPPPLTDDRTTSCAVAAHASGQILPRAKARTKLRGLGAPRCTCLDVQTLRGAFMRNADQKIHLAIVYRLIPTRWKSEPSRKTSCSTPRATRFPKCANDACS